MVNIEKNGFISEFEVIFEIEGVFENKFFEVE